MQEFSTRLSDMLAHEIKLKKSAAADENLRQLYSIRPLKLSEALIVTDKSGFWSRDLPPKKVAAMMNEIVKAACSGDFKPEDLEPLQFAVSTEKSFPRLLIFNKLLEEIALRSTKGEVWRQAISTISLPFYNKVKFELNGTSKEGLAEGCLWNIFCECERQKKAFVAEVISGIQKMTLVTEVFCGALFTDRMELERKAIGKVLDIDSAVVVAALTAYQMSRPKTSSLVFQKLTHEGVCSDPEEGISHMMAIIRGDGYAAEITEMYRRVILGIREILTIKQGPHPWFRPIPGRNGILVPTFATDGIQLNTFLVLSKIPSGLALLTAIDGITKLAFPHVNGFSNGTVDAEPSVKRVFGDISETVSLLLRRSGALEHFHVEAFERMFGKNGGLRASEVDEPTLLLLGPALSRISMGMHELGVSNAPISMLASEGLIRGLLLGTEGKSREERAAIINRNLDIVIERQGKMFLGEDSLPDREDTMMLVRRLAKNASLMQRVKAPKPPKRLNPRIS